jgi:hypothetical protein
LFPGSADDIFAENVSKAGKSISSSVNHFLIRLSCSWTASAPGNSGLDFFAVRNAKGICLLQSILSVCNDLSKKTSRRILMAY